MTRLKLASTGHVLALFISISYTCALTVRLRVAKQARSFGLVDRTSVACVFSQTLSYVFRMCINAIKRIYIQLSTMDLSVLASIEERSEMR